jgi:hypothetical protein
MAIRLSVQQQNDLTRSAIRSAALSFRANKDSKYPWLFSELKKRGLDPATGILAQLEQVPEQFGEEFGGLWLTAAGESIRFAILVPRSDAAAVEIETWQNETAQVEINAHLPGTGKSFGWLALDVLRELNTNHS